MCVDHTVDVISGGSQRMSDSAPCHVCPSSANQSHNHKASYPYLLTGEWLRDLTRYFLTTYPDSLASHYLPVFCLGIKGGNAFLFALL